MFYNVCLHNDTWFTSKVNSEILQLSRGHKNAAREVIYTCIYTSGPCFSHGYTIDRLYMTEVGVAGIVLFLWYLLKCNFFITLVNSPELSLLKFLPLTYHQSFLGHHLWFHIIGFFGGLHSFFIAWLVFD